MKLFTWIEGRQSSANYHKWCFLYFKFWKIGLDGYILRYPKDTNLPIHKDPVFDASHYRINIKLKGKCKFWASYKLFHLGEWFILFRPDKAPHSLTTTTKTYKISIGFVRFN